MKYVWKWIPCFRTAEYRTTAKLRTLRSGHETQWNEKRWSQVAKSPFTVLLVQCSDNALAALAVLPSAHPEQDLST